MERTRLLLLVILKIFVGVKNDTQQSKEVFVVALGGMTIPLLAGCALGRNRHPRGFEMTAMGVSFIFSETGERK